MLRELPPPGEMYDAITRRDRSYEGVFVLGVKTTGIFCRPGCPARVPRPENIEYFHNVHGALAAGYRPCKRCKPMQPAGTAPDEITTLLQEVDAQPMQRWRDQDLRDRGLEPTAVRRWFNKTHGMTFHAYLRMRRLGNALGTMKSGDDPLMAGLASGYESESGFRDAFHKLFGTSPSRARELTGVVVDRLTTPLGPLLAAATNEALVLLEFVDRRALETQITTLQARLGAAFTPGHNDILTQTARELDEYFAQKRETFTVPTHAPGTEFQQRAWRALQDIPYGDTRSYSDQARAIGKPSAVRAVARANGENRIAIIIPCHRIIGKDGELRGYGGQVWRKRALLDLESAQGRLA